MLKLDDEIKLAQIKAEKNEYKPSMSFREMWEKQKKYDEENNNPELSLSEINKYIEEVRNEAL